MNVGELNTYERLKDHCLFLTIKINAVNVQSFAKQVNNLVHDSQFSKNNVVEFIKGLSKFDMVCL